MPDGPLAIQLLLSSIHAVPAISRCSQGVSSTNGRKAFEIVVSPASGLLSPKARFDFWIALVDAKSGQVAAFVHETATDGKIEADPDGTMAHDLAQGLQQVHVGWVRPPAVTR